MNDVTHTALEHELNDAQARLLDKDGKIEELKRDVQALRNEILRLSGNDLEHAFRLAINRFSAENGSNTSDVVLAEYLMACLKAFDIGVVRRERG